MRRVIKWPLFGVLCVTSLGALGQAFRILEEAPLDRAVDFPRERLVELYREIDANDISTTRLLEGGEYNVNIRHLKNVTPDGLAMRVHPDTIDVWIVQEGSGVAVTGGEQDGGGHIHQDTQLGDREDSEPGEPGGQSWGRASVDVDGEGKRDTVEQRLCGERRDHGGQPERAGRTGGESQRPAKRRDGRCDQRVHGRDV